MKRLFAKKDTNVDSQQNYVGKVYSINHKQYVVEEIIAEGYFVLIVFF